MASALTMERVRRDIDTVARAGLEMQSFISEMDASLQRAIPYTAGCVATLDPATMLLTGTYKFGDLAQRDEHAYEWGLVEYGQAEQTTLTELARAQLFSAGVHQTTGGHVSRSNRLREFIFPHFGYTDEARVLARTDGCVWGAVLLFRDKASVPFSDEEIAFLSSLTPVFGAGMRAGTLAKIATAGPGMPGTRPAVIIVGGDDEFRLFSASAAEQLTELAASTGNIHSSGLLSPLVAKARRYAAGQASTLPRSRIRLRSGQWLVLHASPMSRETPAGAMATTGDVAVTIEDAQPPDVIPLMVNALALTARERDVTQLVLQGRDTAAVAKALHLSAYTVQDHLKSVFEKAGVRNRRELTARVFLDHYLPRYGDLIAPSGWFAST